MKTYLKQNKIGILSLSLGIIFIAVGIYRNEASIVLTKAIMVCLECIGIG